MVFVKLTGNVSQNIRCNVCGIPLVVNGVMVEDVAAVVDVLETTKIGDEVRTYKPLLPPFYFCSEHVRKNNTYYLQENL